MHKYHVSVTLCSSTVAIEVLFKKTLYWLSPDIYLIQSVS